MGLAPPNAGEVAIYGSRAGKDDAAGQLTQLFDGHSNSQTPYHSSHASYGTRERWEFTTISVAALREMEMMKTRSMNQY